MGTSVENTSRNPVTSGPPHRDFAGEFRRDGHRTECLSTRSAVNNVELLPQADWGGTIGIEPASPEARASTT
jgi:hypothetical protein